MPKPPPNKLKEANQCIGIGAGVGAIGVGAALITGAVCPICYIAAPALLGIGFFARNKAMKEQRSENQIEASEEPLPK